MFLSKSVNGWERNVGNEQPDWERVGSGKISPPTCLDMQQSKAVPSDDQILEVFVDAFRDAVGDVVSDFDCQVWRDDRKRVGVQVTIYGLDPVPPRQQFFDRCKGADRIAVECGKHELLFHFENSCQKNSNDYSLFYVAKF